MGPDQVLEGPTISASNYHRNSTRTPKQYMAFKKVTSPGQGHLNRLERCGGGSCSFATGSEKVVAAFVELWKVVSSRQMVRDHCSLPRSSPDRWLGRYTPPRRHRPWR